MAKAKGRAKDFQDPDEELAKDYDPEANGNSDNDNGSGLSEDERAGTEHYVTVGRSKLREKEGISLGRQYRGSRVSRQALEEDNDEDEEEDDDDEDDEEAEFDDPETADLVADTAEASDSEISSDNALAESDDERLNAFVFRGSSKPKQPKSKRASAADFMSASEEEDDEDEDEDMDDGLDALLNGNGTSDEDDEEEEEEEEEDDENEDEEDEDEEEESAKRSAKPSPATPSSNQTEVQKGMAIQQQRKIYDGLLNMRIRLQKALVAANTFPTLDSDSSSETEAYEAAEEAAIKLLNTISDLRENLAPPTAAGSKRKRIEIDLSNQQIWEQIQEDDQRAARFREDRLDKWSRKVQSVNVAAPASRLGAKPKTLISALQDQLANPDERLVKRTRVPRSCAPVQASKNITDSEDIYDDADFYQLLLKELVDQRTVESAAEQSSAVASVMLTANKEAKSRKVVDRKASKGRKMRFTVHEKLQNFMASEDRRSWEQAAIDRFFGTLFGQKMELNEEESEDEEMEALYNEDTGLRLF
ncbi:apoptosis-antagonizing transcription factor, partial [Trichoderma compactum]